MYVVITGASRGIGLSLTELALRKGHQVLAVARSPSESRELQELLKDHNLAVLKLDLESVDSHIEIRKAIEAWPRLDVVINNAGVLLEDTTREDFEQGFRINTIVPYFVTKSLVDKLKLSPRPLSVQITSQMGSIEDNSSGGHCSYRSSKAALNMIFKSLSIDEPWLTSIQVHPGWVQTRMGGSGAPITAQQSASGIWDLIENSSPKLNGAFVNYLGKHLPW